MPDTTVTKSQILIVDDEREHAQVMCDALARLGHKCDLAYDLADARSRMERKAYDVLVTDLMMEGRCDGLEVLRKLRADPKTRDLPVLVYSAADDPNMQKQAAKLGAREVVLKSGGFYPLYEQIERYAPAH